MDRQRTELDIIKETVGRFAENSYGASERQKELDRLNAYEFIDATVEDKNDRQREELKDYYDRKASL